MILLWKKNRNIIRGYWLSVSYI